MGEFGRARALPIPNCTKWLIVIIVELKIKKESYVNIYNSTMEKHC
jgi:hypothetical protein